MKNYDLIVIGSGSAGGKVAVGCKKAGWKVAVIDKQPFGGTCAQRGCDPKKILVGAAEIMDRIRLMKGKGIHPGNVRLDWSKLMKFKRIFTEPVHSNVEKNYSRLGIDAYHGSAQFVGKRVLKVKNETLKGKKILIASGQKTLELDIPGKEYLLTSTEFLELDRLPPRILLIGGGYISMEFAHIASRAGSEIQVIEALSKPLRGFDPDLADILVKSSVDAGIKINTSTKVTKVEKKENKFIVHSDNNHIKKVFRADLVINCTGRVPDIDELNLDAAGISREKRGITVNEFLQSISNPDVYAAGDCSAGKNALPLTPVAAREGSIVLENLLKGNVSKTDFNFVPTVVFTLPPLASVGLLEKDAREKGLKFKTVFQDASGWYSSKRIGLKYSGTKVLIEEKTNKILGAHLLYHHADEIITIFSLAMKYGLTVEQIKNTIYTYPTSTYDISYML